MRQNIDILQTFSGVHVTLPFGTHGTATTFPELNNVFKAVEVLIVNSAVVQFLLGLWSIDRIGYVGLVHFGITDKRRDTTLKNGNPVLSDTFALHSLGTPQYRCGDRISVCIGFLEQFSEHRLFTSSCVVFYGYWIDHLSCRVDAHDQLCEFRIQKWDTGFEGVGHGHSIRAVKVDVSKHTIDSTKFVLHLSRVFGILEVQVTRKELIGSLTSQDHLDIHCSTFCEKPVGNGTSDEFCLVCFHVIDNLWNEIKDFIGCKGTNVVADVLGATEFLHHGTSCHDIGGIFHTNSISWNGAIVSEFLAFGTVQWEEIVTDNARVDTSGKEKSIVDIGHHSLLDGLGEGFANFFITNIVVRVFPWSIVIVAEPFGVVVAGQAFFWRPVMARRNGNNGFGISVSDEGLEFAGEDIGTSLVSTSLGSSVVQGLDSDRITGGEGCDLTGLHILFECDESKHTIQHGSGLGTTVFSKGVSDNLTIRSGDSVVIPSVFRNHLLVNIVVVVNFSIGGKVDDFFGSFGARSEFQVEGHVRESIGWIDNGQTGVTHRPASMIRGIDASANSSSRNFVTVGTTMVQDTGRLAECLAVVQNRDGTAGCSGGSGGPNVIDRSHETAHLTLLGSFGSSCQRTSR
mmetsp:Transcript_6916/g.16892  ORF Transcript_6916/g.16892 Transcript_6916/m.16892 type:complete len:627 (+) Transcript_6916:431-2311(+)